VFSDPQSITINAVAKSLPRILIGGTNATYQNSDGSWKLSISHQRSKGRIRSLVRVDNTKVVTDPITSQNDSDFSSVQVVWDRPEVGFSMTEIEQQTAGVMAYVTTANVDKIYGGEF